MEKSNFLVLFFTQYGAISYAKLLEEQGIQNETKPVPRSLSSSCGIGVEMKILDEKKILEYLTEDVEFIYAIEDDGYKLIYENLD